MGPVTHTDYTPGSSIAARLSQLGITVAPFDRSFWELRQNRFARRDVLEQNLLDLKAVFDRHGIPLFLAQGTLLAAARDGQFFEHSTDCDLYVYWRDRNRLVDAVAELSQRGFRIIKLIEKLRLRKITLEHENEVTDINFLIAHGRGLFRHWQVEHARYAARFFDQGEPIRFLDSTFLAPRDFHKYLRHRYGADWHLTVYKLGEPGEFDRIRDRLEDEDVLVAMPYPLWPLGICRYRPISLTAFSGAPDKGSIVLFTSGDRTCLRYVRKVRSDGCIQVHGTDHRTLSTWRPSSVVLARATRLHSRTGVAIPLDWWPVRWAFRFCSGLAVGWKRCLNTLPLAR